MNSTDNFRPQFDGIQRNALIAGIIQAPSYLSPYRHPERALERRNLVLDSMVETHTLTPSEAETAKATVSRKTGMVRMGDIVA